MGHNRAVIAALLLSAIPRLAFADQPKIIRGVELLIMGHDQPPISSETLIPEPSPKETEAFLLHDLSRREIEYRIAQVFQNPGDDAATRASIPLKSSISIPQWLRAPVALVGPTRYSPACAPRAYRPSRLLKADAEARRSAYYDLMSSIACEHGLPTSLFDALIMRESRYNPVALSSKKAIGFAQLMPGTAAYLGIDPHDPVQNLRGGARYLREQLDRFGQVHLALAAYNAGPGRIRSGVIPRITETQHYVAEILANWSRLAGPPEIPVAASQRSRQIFREAHISSF